MEMKKISTSKAAQPGGWYSQAFRIGDLIYTAGITGVDPETYKETTDYTYKSGGEDTAQKSDDKNE